MSVVIGLILLQMMSQILFAIQGQKKIDEGILFCLWISTFNQVERAIFPHHKLTCPSSRSKEGATKKKEMVRQSVDPTFFGGVV